MEPSSNFITGRSKAVLLLWTIFVIFCQTGSLKVTCLERADLLSLMCVLFSCVFATFPFGVLRQVLYLIVLYS